MSLDERGTVAALDLARGIFRNHVESRQGRVVDTAGDSILALFDSATGAVSAALAIQEEIDKAAAAVPEGRRMRFRVGLHLGDVMEKADGTIYGDGVNIAARLQAQAVPGGITLSESIRAAVKGKVKARIEDLGTRRFKNIAEPVQVFQLRSHGQEVASATGVVQRMVMGVRHRSRILASVVLVVAAASAAWIVLHVDSADGARAILSSMTRGEARRPRAERAVVAVLPFANQSGDSAREYFSDGMTEDIIGALGRFSGLMVISQNTVRAFKGRASSPQLLSKELGARYIVQGSLREAAGKIRVAVELSDAEKGVLLWSERYDGEGSELFEIQDRIVRSVAASLQAKLTQLEQQRAFARPTESLEAYDLVLRARSLLDRLDRGANREARALLERARSLAPDYAEILTALGEAEVQRALYGWIEDAEEAMQRAEGLAKRVLTSPDVRTHTRAYVLLGRIHSNLANYVEATRYADQAIAANPSDSAAMYLRGVALLYDGRIDESIVALERAIRVDPGPNVGSAQSLALAHVLSGRFQEALARLDLLVVRFPADVGIQAIRAAALAGLGRLDDARQAAAQVRRLSPQFRVENFGQRFANPELAEKLRAGLRTAGL
jgi:TolB-like protein